MKTIQDCGGDVYGDVAPSQGIYTVYLYSSTKLVATHNDDQYRQCCIYTTIGFILIDNAIDTVRLKAIQVVLYFSNLGKVLID